MNTGDGNESSLSHNPTHWQTPEAIADFLEIAFDAVVTFDARERVTSWNSAAEQLYGWTAQEALGKTPAKLFWPLSTPQAQKERRQRQSRLKRGEILQDQQNVFRKDGSPLCVQCVQRALFDADKKFSGSLAIYREISTQESERKFSILLDKASFAAALSRLPDSVFVDVNEAWVEMFGYSRQEVIGKTALELHINPDVDGRTQLLAQLQETGSAHGIEMTLQAKSGEWRNFLMNFDIVEIDGQNYILTTIQDITERKRAEAQLERSNQRLHEILTSIQDDFYVLNRDWIFVYASRTFSSRIGKEPEEFVGKNIWEVFPKHVGTIFEENFRTAMEKREIRRFEIPGKYTNAWYKMTVFPSAEGITVIGTDITESKRSQEALQESEKRYRHLVKYAPAGIYEIDPMTRRFLEVNDTMCEILGYTREELLAKSPDDLLDDEGRERFRQRTLQILAGEKVSQQTEYKVRTKDGREIWSILNLTIHYEGGKPRSISVIAHDISERKRSEQLMRESEEKFRNVFNQSTIGIGVYDAAGILIDLNQAALEMFGIASSEKIRGLKLFSSPTVREEARERLRHQEQIREEVVYDFDKIRRLGFYETTKTGIFYFDRIITPLRSSADGEPFGYLSQVLDITERKRAEEQLERSNQKLDEILASIQDDFFVIDRNWNFVYANRQFTSKLGKEPEELIGNNVWKLFPKHIGTDFEENLRAAMEKRETQRFEISGKYTQAWYRLNAFPSPEGITVLGTDVTESKRAAEEIQASQQILETVVKHMPACVAMIRGSDLRLQLINPAYQAIAPGKEMVGHTLDEVWPEADQNFTALCRRVLETGEPYEVVDELNMIRRQPDGPLEPAYFSWSLYRVRLPGDEGWGLLNTSFETTARKQAEKTLLESEERLRQMIETSPIAIGFGDSTGKIFGANMSFYRLTGYSREEIEARQIGWDQLTAPEYAEIDRQIMATLTATGSAGPYEKEYICKDGSRVPLLITVSKLPGRDEHIAFLMDITERKQSEETLRELSQRLTYHVDNSPLAVIEWGPDMRLVRWSGAAQRIFGWKAEEVLGKRMEDLRWIYEEDTGQVDEVSADLQTGTDSRRFSANRNYRKDGSVADCEWYNSSLLDESGKLRSILSLVLDVTESKRAQEALQEHQEQLQLLNETLEQKVQEKTAEVHRLASDMIKAVQQERHRISHILHDDLQQRIYAIQMQLTFLHDELQNEAARQEASGIEKQLAEVLEVTRHLSIDLSPPILRGEGLSQAINWLAAQMRQRYGLPIELRAEGPFALYDEELHVLLFNCVRELLFNVVKHAQASRAVVALQWLKTGLQIEVRDDGIGFSTNRLVRPRSGETGEEEVLPSSSGLPTIQHQLSLFGGRMEIRSEPGAGTRIFLTVPTAQARE